MYRTTVESYDCECGGRTCSVPSIFSRHIETKKHKTWESWKSLCCRLIEEQSQLEKRKLLKELKVLVPVISH
jgi:hypothetical protein